jgi:predicted RNA-binding Zn ribbon-like protein
MARPAVGDRAPMLGEPLPLELANATHVIRGRLRDGLSSTDRLADWLGEVRPRLDTPLTDRDLAATSEAHLAMARDLRDCVRELAGAAVDGVQPDPTALSRLNKHVRVVLRWRELSWDDGEPRSRTRVNRSPVLGAICEIAQATVDLFADPHRAEIRRCGAPGCVLYFRKDHPRREWCSTSCGNRVRSARHYRRTKSDPA